MPSKSSYLKAKSSTPLFYVYIVECQDGTYYTGFTKDLQSRVIQHRMGTGANYTKKHGFKRIVYFEKHSNENWAKQRERIVKDAGRVYREILVKDFQKDLLLLQQLS